MKAQLLGSCAVAPMLIFSAVSLPAHAWQEDASATDGVMLEEIIVTATKRAESLQDVSVAVSVVSGDLIERQTISTFAELTNQVPSVMMSEAQAGTNIFIRGVGSGQNFGFEQSVGLFLDGVHYSRGRSFRNPFFDVERVEILKGPQGVLFGKNVVAGAFSVTSKKPTDEFEAELMANWTPEFDGTTISAVISGPVSDELGVRLAGRYKKTDGYVTNTLPGGVPTGWVREEYIVRATAEWQPSDTFSAVLKGEVSQYDREGGYNTSPYRLSEGHLALLKAVDPLAEDEFDYMVSMPGVDDPLFTGLFTDIGTENLTLTMDWDIGDHTLTSISSYIAFDSDALTNNDHTNLNVVAGPQRQRFDSFSEELRITSPKGEVLEYIAGFYYAKEDLNTRLQATLDLSLSALGGVFYSDRLGRNQQFSQETEGWATFGEFTYNVSDSLRLIAGARYTEDKKIADKRLWFSDASTLDNAVPDANIAASYNGVLGVEHNLLGVERKTTNFSPAVTLEWDATENLMLYAFYKQGFKAGGFDEDFTSGILEDFEFEDEKVETFAAGFKASLGNGRAVINGEFFNADYSNLQVSTFSVASFLVGNAAAATTRGFDLEAKWQVSEHLNLGGAFVYLDAYYTDYSQGPCPLDDSGNAIAPTCDLSGEPLQYAPDVSASLYGTLTLPVSNNWEASLYSVMNYSDRFFIAGDIDPDVVQEAFAKVDATLSLNSVDGKYSFAIIGKNLTDKLTTHNSNDIPLAGLFGGKGLSRFIDPPRTITFQATVRF